ncbi:MAG TPA: OsmC family protein [Candidatus Krumholzibacteria bacterium]|nr:OsmC family protein [Candidatus Krumholzibacteria bacterium]
MSSQTQEKKVPEPRNGVDTPTLFATINAVGGQPELAEFQFRATNRWQQGTHSRTRIQAFSGAGGEQAHETEFVYDADHPAVLVGRDQAPTPVEFLLHALASCLTAGIGNIAAARGVTLYEVESTLEGDINLLGLLGLSKEVRNGYQGIRVNFKIKGDAPAEKLEKIVEQSKNRSAVYDVVTNGVPVEITVNAG